MPLAKKRRSPLDRFTDASPTAISAGFSAAMSIGPQPRIIRNNTSSSTSSLNLTNGGEAMSSSSNGFGEGLTGDAPAPGTSWLQGLQSSAAFGGGMGSSVVDLGGSDEDRDSDAENASTSKQGRKPKKARATKRKKTAEEDDPAAVGKTGDGAAAGDDDEAAALRKAQNRIAQREFRQRKQQYIRALEARVELLSTDHDEQVDRLRYALRGLLSENNSLRSLLGSLGRFIGEGLLGGPLQQVGLSRDELLGIINGRSEKTMTDAWQNWPGAKECEALRQLRQEANIPVDGLPEMRGSPGPPGSNNQRGTSSTRRKDKIIVDGAGGSGSRKTQRTETVQDSPLEQDGFDGNDGLDFSMLSSASGTATASQSNFTQHPPQHQNNPSVSAPSGSTGAIPLSSLNPFNTSMTPSAFGFSSTMNGQDDALMASLFGADSLDDAVNGASFYQSNVGRENNFMSQGADHSSNQQGDARLLLPLPVQQQQQQQGGGGGRVPCSTTKRPNLHPSAQAFLNSLRHCQDDGAFERVTALASQLTRIRAAQGRSDFVPIFFPEPDTNASVDLSSVATHDGSTPQTEEDMQRMTQACIRMTYEMSNYRRNPAYHLPPMLRPTHLQLTRPHDPIIDSAPFPSLRDALILHQGTLNLDEVVFHMIASAKVGEGDVFSEETFQMDHTFLLRYPSLATKETLGATNRWRKECGMAPLSLDDLKALGGDGGISLDVPATANGNGTGVGGSSTGSKTPILTGEPRSTLHQNGNHLKNSNGNALNGIATGTGTGTGTNSPSIPPSHSHSHLHLNNGTSNANANPNVNVNRVNSNAGIDSMINRSNTSTPTILPSTMIPTSSSSTSSSSTNNNINNNNTSNTTSNSNSNSTSNNSPSTASPSSSTTNNNTNNNNNNSNTASATNISPNNNINTRMMNNKTNQGTLKR